MRSGRRWVVFKRRTVSRSKTATVGYLDKSAAVLRCSRCFTTVASPISFAYNGRRRRRRLKLPCLPECFMCRLNTGQDAVRFSTASRLCWQPGTRLAVQYCAAFCELNSSSQTMRVSCHIRLHLVVVQS